MISTTAGSSTASAPTSWRPRAIHWEFFFAGNYQEYGEDPVAARQGMTRYIIIVALIAVAAIAVSYAEPDGCQPDQAIATEIASRFNGSAKSATRTRATSKAATGQHARTLDTTGSAGR